MQIPRSTIWSLREGDQNTAVWSLQRALNKLGIPCAEDGDFGPKAKTAAEALQKKLAVKVDGVVGGGTQQALAGFFCDRQERASGLPENLQLSLVLHESGGTLGAVNWSVPGGVDCGMTQQRLYEADYNNDTAIKRVFDAAYQVAYAASNIRELHDIFLARPGIFTSQGAYRVAVLNHNYPALADAISRYSLKNLPGYYTSQQTWVKNAGIKFPDGKAIQTPLEWGQRYSLGNKDHDEPGQAVKLVTSW